MRRFLLTTAASALLILPPYALGQDNKPKAVPKSASPVAPKPAPAPTPSGGGAPAKPNSDAPKAPPASTATTKPAVPPTPSADEKEIRESGEAYAKAFNQKDAKAIAALYTDDAEYIDEDGEGIQGRTAIEASLKEYFTQNPDVSMQLSIASIRFVAPNVAIEDGVTTVAASKTAVPITTRYTAIHTKVAGNWQVASVRDSSLPQPNEHVNRMKQFDWMLGEWVHEGADAKIVFNCKVADNGNFLVRDFAVQVSGRDQISGTQRIGWDAQASKYKSWIFDSDGGASEGYWHRDGDSWVLKMTGVTASGQSASSTTVYTFENAHTMTFQSMDHEVAGVELPDGLKVKIVRRPPKPE